MAWEKGVDPPVWPFWITSTVQKSLFDMRVLTKTVEP
jgi:hypothetical protein